MEKSSSAAPRTTRNIKNGLAAEVPRKNFQMRLYADENYFPTGGTVAERRNFNREKYDEQTDSCY